MTPSRRGLNPALSRADAQRSLTQRFHDAGIESAALDARLLLCAGLGIEHIDLVRDPDVHIGSPAEIIAALAERRLHGEPVSRILGHREFYGLDFVITSAVLDPRPDTEGLVETVLAALAARREAPLKVLDLGVGSGAILGALLSHLPKALGIGVDLSAAACRIARANLAKLGLSARSSIICGSWADALAGAVDVIAANPPYIASGDITSLAAEVREHDPRAALDGGADGLAAYRTLVPAAVRLIAPDGLVVFEIGAGQADSVIALLKQAGLKPIEKRRDLSGKVRVVTATISAPEL